MHHIESIIYNSVWGRCRKRGEVREGGRKGGEVASGGWESQDSEEKREDN
jgi:hypothetical protein